MKISQVIILLNKIDDEYLTELKEEFNHFDHNVSLYFQREIYHCKWSAEKSCWEVKYIEDNDLIDKDLGFEEYLLNHLTGFTSLINDALIPIHLNSDQNKFKELVASIIKELQSLLNKKKVSDEDNLSIFQNTIHQLIKDISEKHLNNYTPQISKFVFQPKIKWLGNVNTLATFLIDFSSNKNNLNKSLMEFNRQAFENLMIYCFVDKDGRSFSEDTVKTYFNPNKIKYKPTKKDVIQLNECLDVEETTRSKKGQN